MLISRQSLFAAASSRWRPFSRSYGTFLPNSLTKVLPFALVYSTRLPVSVCGTVNYIITVQPFLDSSSSHNTIHPVCDPWLSALHQHAASTGILTCCPSHTLSSFCLGPTNPTRTDLPSETLDFRRMRFSLISRYSCQHSHLWSLQRLLPSRLLSSHNAPLPYFRIPNFGRMLEPRYIVCATAFD